MRSAYALLAQAAALMCFVSNSAAQVSVLTHHYDNARTGWNANETALNAQTVADGGFGLRHTVSVDQQLNAQPLIVPGVNLQGQGVHDVAYLATENNTVYAVDAESGAMLLSRNLGTPVPASEIVGGTCDKTSGVVGIDSTPVIDAQAGLLYVVTYTEENNAPTYRLHALNITTLADGVASVIVSASGELVNNTSYQFNAAVSRQRPALLFANSTIYAAFGSFCDHDQSTTRGWMLGWQAGTLTPVPSSMLNNKLVQVPQLRYLTSIWMSGNGPAADAQGNVYVVTGNSDRSGTTYDPVNNPAESVLRLSADLSAIEDYFTPGGRHGEPLLDIHDRDFGAGGVLLLPPQPGAVPNLAVALGKIGTMYLLNQQQLGGYVPNGPDNVVASVKAGGCWCGESYFTGADGAGRVVTSGGANEIIWRVRTQPTTGLVKESEAAPVPTGGGEGFFSSVSSNGTQSGSAVVWAVARPNRTGALTLTLLAYNGADSTNLFSGAAGVWSSNAANANVVPVVANGYVYVGSYKAMEIFGLANKRK